MEVTNRSQDPGSMNTSGTVTPILRTRGERNTKQMYFCGAFTIEAEMKTAIRKYSSSSNANSYFAKQAEKQLSQVIYSFAYPVDFPDEGASYEEVLKFRERLKGFEAELYKNGMWTLKIFYPDQYKEIFGGV